MLTRYFSLTFSLLSLYACGSQSKQDIGPQPFRLEPLGESSARAVVLSGGDSPLSNHYSQYLQAKNLNAFSQLTLGSDAVNILFGAGNTDTSSPTFGDVHRILNDGSVKREVMEVGRFTNNIPATIQGVRGVLSKDRYKKTDSLFLLVGDHGMPNRLPGNVVDTHYSNNCINLWGVDTTASGSAQQRSFADRCLSVRELGELLRNTHPQGPTVFAMSQCFSGGFHQMSVHTEDGFPTADIHMCGFTAVTEDTYASGCTADADGPTYQGYERYLAEGLSGKDVVTGAAVGASSITLEEAHRKAVLRDLTVDIPLRTSDYLLWQWAKLIRQNGFQLPHKTSPLQVRSAFFDGANLNSENISAAFEDRENFVREVIDSISKSYPLLKNDITGDLGALDDVVQNLEVTADNLMNQLEQSSTQYENYVSKTLTPEWKKAVRAGTVPGLKNSYARLEEDFSDKSQALWKLAFLSVQDKAQAEELSNYLRERPLLMAAWARSQPDLSLQQTNAETDSKTLEELSDQLNEVNRNHGLLRRVAIYRSVLGAWAALKAGAETDAINTVAGLVTCESTRFAQ